MSTNLQKTVALVRYTKEILNGKLQFLFSNAADLAKLEYRLSHNFSD